MLMHTCVRVSDHTHERAGDTLEIKQISHQCQKYSSCLMHRSTACNDSNLTTGTQTPLPSPHVAPAPFLHALIRQRGTAIYDKFQSYLNVPHLSAESAEQVLLLSAVAQGPVPSAPRTMSQPLNTDARLSTLSDVGKFDTHSWGMDAVQ